MLRQATKNLQVLRKKPGKKPVNPITKFVLLQEVNPNALQGSCDI